MPKYTIITYQTGGPKQFAWGAYYEGDEGEHGKPQGMAALESDAIADLVINHDLPEGEPEFSR